LKLSLWGSEHQGASTVTVDADGNIIVTGVLEGTVYFGGTLLTNTGIYSDIFMAKVMARREELE
jgi:septum formation inhibitor MinC